MKPILTETSCMMCQYSSKERQGDQVQMFCRFNPPAVTVLMVNGPKGPVPMPIASFAPVQAEMYCGQFKRRIIHEHASSLSRIAQ